MADTKTVASWSADLEDGISGPAADAAKALDDLAEALKRDRQELAAMQRGLKDIKQSTQPNIQEYLKLKQAITQKTEAIAAGSTKYLEMGGTFKKTGDKAGYYREQIDKLKEQLVEAKHAQKAAANEVTIGSEAINGMRGALSRLPGPLGQFASKLFDLNGKLDKHRLLQFGLKAGFIAVAAAALLYTKRLATLAIASQNARRNELLHMQALTKVRNLWGFKPGNAKEMQGSIDRIAPNVSIARSEVAGLQQQLYQAGLRGKTLDTVLEAAAIKQSALGGAAGSAFADFAASVRLAGGSAERAAQDVKNRFGGVVAAKMSSLEVQALKSQEAIAGLFSGIDIEPYLTANRRLNDVMNASTEAGKALKLLLSGIAQPFVNGWTTGLVVLRRFFKQMLIGALTIQLAWKTLELWFVKTLGGPQTKKVWDGFFESCQWGKWAVYALAAGFAILAGEVLIATWPFVLGVAALWGFYNTLSLLVELWRAIEWKELGAWAIEGLVNGFKDMWHVVKETIEDLGRDAQKWFADILMIRSPSKVFAVMGMEIPRGVKQGIDKGAPEVQKATEDMAPTPPTAAATAPAAAPAAAAKRAGGGSVVIQNLNVTAPAGADAKGFAQSVRRELETVLEGLAGQLGAGV